MLSKTKLYKCDRCRDAGVIKTATTLCQLESRTDNSMIGSFVDPTYTVRWNYISCPNCKNVFVRNK